MWFRGRLTPISSKLPDLRMFDQKYGRKWVHDPLVIFHFVPNVVFFFCPVCVLFCPECIFNFVPTAVCLFCPVSVFFLYRCVFFVPETPLRFPAQRRITTWGFRGVRVGEASHAGAPRRHMSRPIEDRDVTPRLHLDRVIQVDDDSDVHVSRCKGGSQATVMPQRQQVCGFDRE